MQERKVPMWIAYTATVFAVAYSLVKYMKCKKKGARQLKEEGTASYIAHDYEDALKKYYSALSAIESQEIQPMLLAQIYNNISQTYFAMEKYDEARSYAEKTLEVNSRHVNTFYRLAKMEKMNKGYGDTKGLAVIAAYLIIAKYGQEDKDNEKKNKDITSVRKLAHLEEWHKVLDEKVSILAKKKASMLPEPSDLQVSFVKLEEILLIFKDVLRDSSFGEAKDTDENILLCIDRKDYSMLISHLEKQMASGVMTKRSNFVIGNIMFIRNNPRKAIEYLSASQTVYGDVLAIYIHKLNNVEMDLAEEQLSSMLKKKEDPIIKMYLAQIYLATNSIGQYLTAVLELENEGAISLPFIANAKSQIAMREQKEAVGTIRKALEKFPEDINIYCAAVDILSQLADVQERSMQISAEEAQNMLISLLDKMEQKEFDTSPRAVFYKYIGYTAVGDNAKAEIALRKAKELDPNNRSILLQQAHSVIRMGDPEGLSLFEQAAKVSPENAEEAYIIMLTYKSVFLVQEIYPDISSLAVEKEKVDPKK